MVSFQMYSGCLTLSLHHKDVTQFLGILLIMNEGISMEAFSSYTVETFFS